MGISAGILADALLVLHALVVLFIVGGQTVILLGWIGGWQWTRSLAFRLAHLGAIAFVVVQTWLGQLCPLTLWENALRRKAGEEGYGESFIAYWLERVLYWSFPHWMFVAAYSAFGALVLLTMVAYPPRRRR